MNSRHFVLFVRSHTKMLHDFGRTPLHGLLISPRANCSA